MSKIRRLKPRAAGPPIILDKITICIHNQIIYNVIG
nr:MAG TPA: hypothetical protein [Caudoviricetes sp.]